MNKKRVYLAIGGFSIAFLLGTMLVVPVFNKKTGLELIQEALLSTPKVVGDETLTGEPYHYTEFIKPANSFGLGNTTFTEVNWTYWQKWVNNTIECYLEKSLDNQKTWKDCTKLLHVAKDWDETNVSVKFTFSWVSDEDAHYRVSYKTKHTADMSSSSDKTSKGNKYLLNYSVGTRGDETYSCSYNWTDYKNSNEYSKTTFTKEVIPHTTSNKPEFVWCVTTKDILKKGQGIEIDPTLGSNNEDDATNIAVLDNKIEGIGDCTASSSGTANSIFARLKNGGQIRNSYAYLYEWSGSQYDLIGTTSSLGWDSASYVWEEFTFSSSPAITSSNVYAVVVAGDSGTGNSYIANSNADRTKGLYYHGTESSDPLAGGTWYNTYTCSIYCSYTESSANTAPVSNDLYPGNASTGISATLGNWSVQITDADGENTMGNFSLVPTGYMNYGTQWNSTGGGTREVNLSTLLYNTEYKMYVNFSDTAMDLGDEVNNWFTFTTETQPEEWHTFSTVTGSIYNTSTWGNLQTFSTVTGSIYNTSTWGNLQTFSTVTGSIYNSSGGYGDWQTFSTVTGSIFNTSTWGEWNTFSTVTGSIYNTSTWGSWNTFSTVTGSIYNSSGGYGDWQTFSTVTGSIFNTSATPPIDLNSEYPSNTTKNIPLQPLIYITVNSSTGLTMNLTFYTGTTETNADTLLGTNVNISNSTHNHDYFAASTRSTTFYWRVWANDGTNHLNETYKFKTEGYPAGPVSQPSRTYIYGVIGLLGIALVPLILWKIKKKRENDDELY